MMQPPSGRRATTGRRSRGLMGAKPTRTRAGCERPAASSARKQPRLSTVPGQLATVRVVGAPEKDKLEKTPLRHRKVGAYRVLGELGRGGMAQVYKGIHEQLQREVALKELFPEAQKDKESLSRFHREALALAAFRHQNIVTLYDLVEKNDSLFMVMEYVDGPTLH